MNKILLLGFSVLLFCAAAQSLMCKVCNFKVSNICLSSEDLCKPKDGHFCETTEVYTGTIKLFTKYGCNKISALCNKTEQTDAIFNMSFNRTCCNFNLCNGGVINTFCHPFISGLSLALGWWLSH